LFAKRAKETEYYSVSSVSHLLRFNKFDELVFHLTATHLGSCVLEAFIHCHVLASILTEFLTDHGQNESKQKLNSHLLTSLRRLVAAHCFLRTWTWTTFLRARWTFLLARWTFLLASWAFLLARWTFLRARWTFLLARCTFLLARWTLPTRWRHHLVTKFVPNSSYRSNAWVRCASGNVSLIFL